MKDVTHLRNKLFDVIDKIESKEISIEQAKSIKEVAQVIVNSAKAEIDVMKIAGRSSSKFIPINKPKLPMFGEPKS